MPAMIEECLCVMGRCRDCQRFLSCEMLVNNNYSLHTKNWIQPTHVIWQDGEQDSECHLQDSNP